jgi:membrane fusion protein, copper/silver efflux system
MKKTLYSVLFSLTIAAAFLAGSWSGWRTAAEGSVKTPRILYYVDPMHPAYKSDTPGVAPDCGMQLQPVYADGRPAAAQPESSAPIAKTARIGSDEQQAAGIRVSTVESAAGSYAIRIPGRIAADETRTYRVTAGIEGFIREVSPVTTGSRVKKNQLLATFSAPNAATVIQQYLQVLVATDHAKEATAQGGVEAQMTPLAASNLRQRTDQLQNLGMSPVQMEEMRRTREFPASIKILSPVDGFVFARNVSPDMKFDRGQELYRIADLQHVWIVADLLGRDAEIVRPGMPARVTLPDSDRIFDARVSDIALQFNPVTRIRTVRLEVDNPGAVLRPDMYVDVELTATFATAIVVPADAVLDTGLRQTVFVERAPGSYEQRSVKTGWRRDRRVEIIHGLEAGDRVVTEGTFLLDSESRMRRSSIATASPR